jgi:hypothetical protein
MKLELPREVWFAALSKLATSNATWESAGSLGNEPA